MLNEEILELVIVELATKSTSPKVYQYLTPWGIPVVYYTFNTQKLEEGIYEPLYFTLEDVRSFDQTEDELFQKVLDNTTIFMRCQIIPFSSYLEDFIPNETDCTRWMIMDRLVKHIEGLENKRKLWCITSNIRQRGACCGFYKPMLKAFCEVIECPRLLVGMNNQDYALLIEEKSCKPEAVRKFICHTGHVIENQDEILQKDVLVYDCELDTLTNYTGK